MFQSAKYHSIEIFKDSASNLNEDISLSSLLFSFITQLDLKLYITQQNSKINSCLCIVMNGN